MNATIYATIHCRYFIRCGRPVPAIAEGGLLGKTGRSQGEQKKPFVLSKQTKACGQMMIGTVRADRYRFVASTLLVSTAYWPFGTTQINTQRWKEEMLSTTTTSAVVNPGRCSHKNCGI